MRDRRQGERVLAPEELGETRLDLLVQRRAPEEPRPARMRTPRAQRRRDRVDDLWLEVEAEVVARCEVGEPAVADPDHAPVDLVDDGVHHRIRRAQIGEIGARRKPALHPTAGRGGARADDRHARRIALDPFWTPRGERRPSAAAQERPHARKPSLHRTPRPARPGPVRAAHLTPRVCTRAAVKNRWLAGTAVDEYCDMNVLVSNPGARRSARSRSLRAGGSVGGALFVRQALRELPEPERIRSTALCGWRLSSRRSNTLRQSLMPWRLCSFARSDRGTRRSRHCMTGGALKSWPSMPQCPMVERRAPSPTSWVTGPSPVSLIPEAHGRTVCWSSLVLRRAVASLDSFRRLERPLMPAVNWDEMPYEPVWTGVRRRAAGTTDVFLGRDDHEPDLALRLQTHA